MCIRDSMGALQLSGTTAFSPRTKHIFRGTILCASWLHRTSVSHVKATDQLADLFTRFLNYPKFKAILDKIINFASWASLQDHHQHLRHHLYLGACVCCCIVICMRYMFNDFCMFPTLCSYKVFVIPDFYQIHSDMSFLKYMFWIIGLIYSKCLRRSPR